MALLSVMECLRCVTNKKAVDSCGSEGYGLTCTFIPREGSSLSMSVTMEPLPARDLAQGPPRTVGSLDGTVLLHIDPISEEYWIEAKPEHDPKSLCMLLTQADWWGLEEMDEEECPAEVQPSGSVRIYLAAKPAPEYRVELVELL